MAKIDFAPAFDVGLSVKWCTSIVRVWGDPIVLSNGEKLYPCSFFFTYNNAKNIINGTSYRIPTAKEWKELLDNSKRKHCYDMFGAEDGILFTLPNGKDRHFPFLGSNQNGEIVRKREIGEFWCDGITEFGCRIEFDINPANQFLNYSADDNDYKCLWLVEDF